MDDLYKEKLSHLNDLVNLSRVDGTESPSEVNFINSVADRLEISPEDLQSIRDNKDVAFTPPNDVYKMMMQYHRLMLLMGIDRIVAEEEMDFCIEVGIKMGLKLEAIQEVIEEVIDNPRHILTVDEIERIFYKYYKDK